MALQHRNLVLGGRHFQGWSDPKVCGCGTAGMKPRSVLMNRVQDVAPRDLATNRPQPGRPAHEQTLNVLSIAGN